MVRIRSFCHSSHLAEAGAKRPRHSFGIKEFRRQFKKGDNPMKELKLAWSEKRKHLRITKKSFRDAKFLISRGAFRCAANVLKRESYYEPEEFERLVESVEFEKKRFLRASKSTVPKAAVEVSIM